MADVHLGLLDTWTPERAWWWGVLLGDGNVFSDPGNGDYRVSVVGSVTTTARWLVLISSEGAVREISHANDTFEAYLHSKVLVERCTALGVCGPKSHTLSWPEGVPLTALPHLLRGLVDTDGSLHFDWRTAPNARGNICPRVKYTSACRAFVERLRDVLEATYGVPRVTVTRDTKTKNGKTYVCFSIRYTGTGAMLFADALYGTAPEHLRNEDRMVVYREMCALREQLAVPCACGAPVFTEGQCKTCWWKARGAAKAETARLEELANPTPPVVVSKPSRPEPQSRQQIRRRYYENHIENDKVTVWCDFCQEHHTALRKTHDANVKRNGTYICERHGGYLAGSKPKAAPVNPYAAEGKKECSVCKGVLPLDQFGVRKASWDGLNSACSGCMATRKKLAYEKSKLSHPKTEG